MKQNIATTPKQSKRLLACGVDPKSADMIWQEPISTSQKRTGGKILVFRNPSHQIYVGDVPAWSLSRLLSLMPVCIDADGLHTFLSLAPYFDENDVCCWSLSYYDHETEANLFDSDALDLIECCVRMIEWLTANGYKLNEIL